MRSKQGKSKGGLGATAFDDCPAILNAFLRAKMAMNMVLLANINPKIGSAQV